MKILISERLSQHKYKTPEGYLICQDAILARTGKQTYTRGEVFGQDTRDAEADVEVDRTYDEVFSPQTLASFENKPVTVEHPDEDVNSENYKDYAVGFVRDVKQGKTTDGEDVILGTLVITDADTIKEIENGEHTELSCGYDCDILDEENPQQRHIRGNHVALCEHGRAGIAKIVDSEKVKDSVYKIFFFDKKEKNNKFWICNAKSYDDALNKFWDMMKDDYSSYDVLHMEIQDSVDDSVKDSLESDVNRAIDHFEKGIKINAHSYNEFNKVRELALRKKVDAEYNDRTGYVKFIYDSIGNSIKDSYYLVGGYKNKNDAMLRKDIKAAEMYGLRCSIEEMDDGTYQLEMRGPKDKLKKALDDYFGLDSSAIGDAVEKNYKIYVKNVFGSYKVADWPAISKEAAVKEFLELNPAYKNKGIIEARDSIKDVNPRSGESKNDFIARFMEETKSEYPDEKQRLAVAYSYWENKGKKDSRYDKPLDNSEFEDLIGTNYKYGYLKTKQDVLNDLKRLEQKYNSKYSGDIIKNLEKKGYIFYDSIKDDFDKEYANKFNELESDVRKAKQIWKGNNKTPSQILESMGYTKKGRDEFFKKEGQYLKVISFAYTDVDDFYYYVLKDNKIPSGWTRTHARWMDSITDAMELSSTDYDDLCEQIQHQQKLHPTWKFGDIEKRSGLFRVNVIKDSIQDATGVKVWQCHGEYAIVPRKYWKQYGQNAFTVDRRQSLEDARRAKYSFEIADHIDYIIIDCTQSGTYKALDSLKKYEIHTEDSNGNVHIKIVKAESVAHAVVKAKDEDYLYIGTSTRGNDVKVFSSIDARYKHSEQNTGWQYWKVPKDEFKSLSKQRNPWFAFTRLNNEGKVIHN